MRFAPSVSFCAEEEGWEPSPRSFLSPPSVFESAVRRAFLHVAVRAKVEYWKSTRSTLIVTLLVCESCMAQSGEIGNYGGGRAQDRATRRGEQAGALLPSGHFLTMVQARELIRKSALDGAHGGYFCPFFCGGRGLWIP